MYLANKEVWQHVKDQRQICPKSYGMAATHIGEVETNTYRPAHILGRPGGEAKGLGSWAINQLVAFLNLSIVLSAHCTLYKTYPHSALNIELDCIVPAGPRPILIVSPPGHTYGQTGQKAPGFIAPLPFRLLGTCYCRHRGFTSSQFKQIYRL